MPYFYRESSNLLKKIKKQKWFWEVLGAWLWIFPIFGLTQVQREQLEAAYAAWQFPKAHAWLEAWDLKEDPEWYFYQGLQAFYEGRYTEAIAYFDQAETLHPTDALIKKMEGVRERVEATLEVLKDHDHQVSPDGFFEIYYPRGKDQVLVPFAMHALDRAYQALGEDFGVYPPTPIRVEIYRSAEDLAKVSPLTVKAIETSGTIALCKYNRLMLTSPKALARGYPWLDTLVHEYVHMIVNIAGGGQVPIWLHEGLAKFSERRWRGPEHRLSAYGEYLLYHRAREGKIITFEQMNPSMALLPSQEDTSMAFAEVYAAVEMIERKAGMEGLRNILKDLKAGVPIREAIGKLYNHSFEAFLEAWKKAMISRPRRYRGDRPPDVFKQVAFKKRASTRVPSLLQKSTDSGDEAVKKWVHLGELLEGKGWFAAASVEYRKASQSLAKKGETNPILQARLGKVLMDQGLLQQSIEVMKIALTEGDSYGTLYLYLGKAYSLTKDWEKAKEMLWNAAALNPFDPEIYRYLTQVYEGLKDQEGVAMANQSLKILSVVQ